MTKPNAPDAAVPANSSSDVRHDADEPTPLNGYAGDVSPALAYQWQQAGHAQIIDVRSDAERAWVGFVENVPGVAWKHWPGMLANPEFDVQLAAAAPAGSRVILMCRSGVRSIPAAQRAQQLGYTAYNMLEGFEGEPDEHAHRSCKNGWRYRGLPWRQN